MKVIISTPGHRVEATLYDTPTGRAVYGALPLSRNVNRWGDEIYFGIPVHAPLEADAKAEVAVGDLAYWPNMPAFCIFFGPTPVSSGQTPVAASPVNIFGKLSMVEVEKLRRIRDDETITVEKAG